MATYSTTFSATENPLSESGAWTEGAIVGLDWNNMQSGSGNAYGTQFILTGYADNVACLSGFGTSQYIEGVVYRAGGYSPTTSHEIELLTKCTISANSITTYELLIESSGSHALVRWNGAAGNFTVLTPTGTFIDTPVNGDVIRLEYHAATSTLYAYYNGVKKWTCVDTNITTGSPGIAAFSRGGDTVLANFGWQSITAGEIFPVAFSSSNEATAGTGSSVSTSLTVAGDNPGIIYHVWLNSATANVNSVAWSLGSGTPVKIKETRGSSGVLVSSWFIPTPTAGSGTCSATLSASVLSGGMSEVWVNVGDVPSADAVSSNTTATTTVLTPTNLAIIDASSGAAANIVAGNWVSAAVNQRTISNVTDPGYVVGDSVGTTGVTFVNDAGVGAGNMAAVAVRIQAYAPPLPVITLQPAYTTVSDGSTAQFSVAATFFGASPTYQWQDNRTGSFTNVSGGSGATTATYTTATVTQHFSSRQYRCVVSDSAGSTNSNSASLTVSNISVILWDTSVQSGNDAWLRDPTLTAASSGYTVSIDEAMSLGAIQDAVISLSASISEAITLVETASNVAALAASISEAMTLANTQSNVAAFGVSISEGITLTESVSNQASLSAAATESLTLADSANRQTGFATAISESLPLADTASNAATLSASQTESMNLADTSNASGAGAYNASQTEAISLADNASVVAALSASITEGITLAHTQTNIAALSSAISEGILLSDSAANVAAFGTSISESMALADSENTASGGGSFSAGIIEALNLIESINQQAALTAGLTEAMVLDDVSSMVNSGTALDRQYPLEGLVQDTPLMGQSLQYPLEGLTQTRPLS